MVSSVQRQKSVLIQGVKKMLLALLVGVLVYGADQWVKHLVETSMTLGEKIPVIEGLLWWYYIKNSGAAFSMGENTTWIFTIFAAIAAVVALISLVKAKSLWWVVVLSLFLAGVLGNLTDRLFREPGFGVGQVVDFIALPHFAIFNIADMAICCSIGAMVLLMLRGLKIDGTFEPTKGKGE